MIPLGGFESFHVVMLIPFEENYQLPAAAALLMI